MTLTLFPPTLSHSKLVTSSSLPYSLPFLFPPFPIPWIPTVCTVRCNFKIGQLLSTGFIILSDGNAIITQLYFTVLRLRFFCDYHNCGSTSQANHNFQPMSNSRTFPGFPDGYPPCQQKDRNQAKNKRTL